MKIQMKKTIPLILVIGLAFVLGSSCAVHTKFPFICFVRTCVKEQWHIGEMKLAIKRTAYHLSKRTKQHASTSKKYNRNESISSSDHERENDSLLVKNDSILSLRKGFDTTIVFYFKLESDSLEYEDLQFIERYFKNYKMKGFHEIEIREYYEAGTKYSHSERRKRVVSELNGAGVPGRALWVRRKQKIKSKDANRRERVEVKLR